MPSIEVRQRAAERRRQVVDLRAKGLSFMEIGRRVGGVSPQMAHKLWRQALVPRPAGPVPRPGRSWTPDRVFLAALGKELATLATPDPSMAAERRLRAASRRLSRLLPPDQPVPAAKVTTEALVAAAGFALGLSKTQARRIVAEALMEPVDVLTRRS